MYKNITKYFVFLNGQCLDIIDIMTYIQHFAYNIHKLIVLIIIENYLYSKTHTLYLLIVPRKSTILLHISSM